MGKVKAFTENSLHERPPVSTVPLMTPKLTNLFDLLQRV
jgi:hypothetical protein